VEQLFTFQHMMALATLTGLEIVLGIDNVIFIAILAGKLRQEEQGKARKIGLILAMVMRVLLLLSISWVMGLTSGLFGIPMFWTPDSADVHEVSGRDLILIVGGLFLLAKSTYEIHDKLEGEHEHGVGQGAAKFANIVIQIMFLDIVFSLDSVITAVGMVQTSQEEKWIGLTIMITAVVISIVIMLAFAGTIAAFVDKHPTLKMLALSFLLMIGVMLMIEGFHGHIPKGYIYFAMAFSLGVELLNMRLRKVSSPVKLHQSYVGTEPGDTTPLAGP